ncbi:hypothetical protein QVZ41_02940 [Wenyingzhuangia sp. chi5]|uniref:6-bladed beta-propeller protein n=1 Tax=Wenyingzhuangia gilva TaxID=3057677 RepID=A0ABT8VPA6_9FLAO|nr:hypothetical protein [Wenyingzhuangia sp. chi5]MDO3693803.1 hypothetical protein [Wenyingzhuangia sp. chi5]
MKKIISVVVLLFGIVSFSQSIKVDESLTFSNVGSYKVDGTFFSILNVKNHKTKKYECLIYTLKDSVSYYIGKFDSDAPQNLELYHRAENNLVLVFSTKERFYNSTPAYNDEQKDYTLFSINLTSKEANTEKLYLATPTLKFSSKDYSCFVYIDKEKFEIVTIKDYKKKEKSETVLPNEIVKSYAKTKFKALTVVSGIGYSENIGAPGDRLFYDEDNIYMTYLNPKIRHSLILKFTRNENKFMWSGYNELPFGFDKKVKGYNSFLTRDRFYFIAENENQVSFSNVDLKSNVIKNYNLNDLARKDTIDKIMLTKVILGIGSKNKVPSLTVYKQKGTDNEIVSVSCISRETYYNDLFQMQFHQQMMMQQQQMMQQQMQNIKASIPGGFNVISIPYPFINDKTVDKKILKFVIDSNQQIMKYRGEEFELKKIDYAKDVDLLESYLDNKIDKFKIKYMSFIRLKNEGLYYAYYDKRKDEIVFGILKIDESN